jgi:hypothetical protein
MRTRANCNSRYCLNLHKIAVWARARVKIWWNAVQRVSCITTCSGPHSNTADTVLFLVCWSFNNISFPSELIMLHLSSSFSLQSTAGLPLQILAISLYLRLLASSFCQPFCAIRHSTWPEGVLKLSTFPEMRSPLQNSLYCSSSIVIYLRSSMIPQATRWW